MNIEEFVDQDSMQGTTVAVFKRYQTAGGVLSKTMFSKGLTNLGWKRVSMRVGDKIDKAYKYVGIAICDKCGAKGFVDK